MAPAPTPFAADGDVDADVGSYCCRCPPRRHRARRSQKWKLPSEPAVAKTVDRTGWNCTSLTDQTFVVTFVLSRALGESRWHLNVKEDGEEELW